MRMRMKTTMMNIERQSIFVPQKQRHSSQHADVNKQNDKRAQRRHGQRVDVQVDKTWEASEHMTTEWRPSPSPVATFATKNTASWLSETLLTMRPGEARRRLSTNRTLPGREGRDAAGPPPLTSALLHTMKHMYAMLASRREACCTSVWLRYVSTAKQANNPLGTASDERCAGTHQRLTMHALLSDAHDLRATPHR